MEKEKKPIYKKWWFWLIIVVVIIGCVGGNSSNNMSNTSTSTNDVKTDVSKANEKKEKAKIAVIDFSQMPKEEIQAWCNTNKLSCTITEDYSDIIEKGAFVSQSIQANEEIEEGNKITIVYSLGRKPTTEEKNALKKAESYSKTMHMSKKGIYEQLTSEYGEKFPAEAAQYAIDNMEADWNANALEKAKSYQTTMSMSKSAIYDQLVSDYGEKFTKEEAQYAIDHLED